MLKSMKNKNVSREDKIADRAIYDKEHEQQAIN